MRTSVGLWAALLVLACGAARAQERTVESRVESVTLYRGQALVTRAVPVADPAGRAEVVVSGLPERVQPDSLFAGGTADVEVRAVRFRTRAVGEAPREEVRKLDKEAERLDAEIARCRKMQELVKQRSAYLDTLEDFVAVTAKMELSHGVLNAETLQKLTLFSFEQRKGLADESLRLAAEEKKLTEDLGLVQRRRQELASGASRTVREAVIFLEKRIAAAAEVKLSYLVSGAGWSPAYNFRAGEDGKEVRVEYNALVNQMSGEDWNAVTLALSTASPALSATPPSLAPFRVALAPGRAQEQEDVSERYRGVQRRLQTAQVEQSNAMVQEVNIKLNWDMNRAANEFQVLELRSGAEQLRTAQREREGTEGPSVSYALAGKASLASRADQQMIRIFETKLPGKLYHVASPLLTTYVYQEADLTNTAADVLLSGLASVYLDGRFVGRAEIPTVAVGQSFVIGFGADSQLRGRRELADKTESTRGGNREVQLRYRLVVENYKQNPVSVRLMDRIPVADGGADVRVTLGETKEKLSTDKVYLRLERPKGILRWDVQVPARAAGENAYILEYDYKLEFDRNLALTAPGGAKAAEMQREFEDLQMKRSLK